MSLWESNVNCFICNIVLYSAISISDWQNCLYMLQVDLLLPLFGFYCGYIFLSKPQTGSFFSRPLPLHWPPRSRTTGGQDEAVWTNLRRTIHTLPAVTGSRERLLQEIPFIKVNSSFSIIRLINLLVITWLIMWAWTGSCDDIVIYLFSLTSHWLFDCWEKPS